MMDWSAEYSPFKKVFLPQSGSKVPNSKAMQYRGIPLGSYDDGTRIDVGLVTIFTRCRWFDWMLDCRPWRMWMVEVVVNPVIWTIATATIAVGVSPSSVRKLKKTKRLKSWTLVRLMTNKDVGDFLHCNQKSINQKKNNHFVALDNVLSRMCAHIQPLCCIKPK